MRIWTTIVASMVGVALFAPRPVAANSPPRPPTIAIDLIRDMRLSVLARRALAEDRNLARYRVGVEVRGGVAKLWGEVPSPDIEEQVKAKVDGISGIHGVRSEMIVGTTKLELAEEKAIPSRVPSRIVVESAKPDTETGTIRKRNQAVVVGGEVPRAVKPGGLPGAIPPRKDDGERAVLRAPMVRRETPPPRARDEPQPKLSLAEAVAKVKSSQDRFRTISVEVAGDSVTISRAGADDSAVTALREALRRVKGVAEVIVTSD